MSFANNKTTALVLATVATLFISAQACVVSPAPPAPQNDDAFFDLTNDTFDQVDVLIGGALADSLQPGETHTYDLGLAGTYNIQIGKTGDTSGELNNIDIFFGSGVTTWSVFDNAPVVFATNNYPYDAMDVTVDNIAYQFAISQNNSDSTVVFDSTLNPGETGFLLIDTDQNHVIDFYDYTTGQLVKEDSAYFQDGDHVSFSFP